jgi:hypothetical protein
MCATNGRSYKGANGCANQLTTQLTDGAHNPRTFYITDNKSDERPYMRLW